MVLIEIIQQFIPLLTLLSGFFIVIFILSLITKQRLKISFIDENTLILGFLVSLAATFGSLFYSEILSFSPCKLCWIQRIFMYPQVLLFLIAIWKKDNKVWLYAIPLSIIGGIIALYHYLLQLNFLGQGFPCSSIGYSARCSEQFVLLFGYITIPMMALTAFILIILFGYIANKNR